VARAAHGRNPRLSARHVVLTGRLAVMGETAILAGVVAALSVASDLTRGHPPGETMRACLAAVELARRAGLDGAAQAESITRR
jgi:NAD(P)H-hydrate repair Nnr-like enzyme with NAD(P)H-hydrate dehydratase domain